MVRGGKEEGGINASLFCSLSASPGFEVPNTGIVDMVSEKRMQGKENSCYKIGRSPAFRRGKKKKDKD